MSFLSGLWYELFPLPHLLAANCRVRRGPDQPDGREAKWVTLGRETLLPLLSDEWERAKQLDEKLFKVTTALSIAVAAVGVASKAVLDALPSGPVKVSVLVVLLYAIGSLFAGTVMGFSGLRPKPRAGYGPDFALQIRHDNKRAAEAIAGALAHFEVNNILRSNEAMAANTAIRNGVIAFALAMTFSLFIPVRQPTSPAPPAEQISITIGATPAPSPTAVNLSQPSLERPTERQASHPTRHPSTQSQIPVAVPPAPNG